MKTKQLKLNKLKLNQLSAKQLNAITGGEEPPRCTCGCCYAGSGGSSSVDNAIANNEGGLFSPNCDKATD